MGIFANLRVQRLTLLAALALCFLGSLEIPVHADLTRACALPITQIKPLGSLTIGGSAAQLTSVEWGAEQGCFKKYGLDIKIATTPSAQIGIAGLISGTYDLTATTPTNLLTAVSNGNFSGAIIAPRHGYTAQELTRAKQEPLYPCELLMQTVVLVKKDSTIRSWKDLTGRKIGIRSINGADNAGVLLAMRASGVNSAHTQFLTMTDSQMSIALDRGDVDAAIPSDPNASQMILGGARVIGYPYAYYAKPGSAIVYISSQETVVKKKAAMKAFQRASLEINSLLNKPENEGSMRTVIAAVTGVSQEAAAKDRLPTMMEKNVAYSEIAYLYKELLFLGYIKSRIDLAPILFR